MPNSKSKVINFMAMRKGAYAFSALLLLISIASLATRGLEFGLDFTGGVLVEVEFGEQPDLDVIRSSLEANGLVGGQVQNFGGIKDVLVRMPPNETVESADISNKILGVFETLSFGDVDMRRVEYVGPQVGEELRDQGGLAVLYALFGIVIYVWFRFERKFSFGSVLALTHDVLITLGFFSLTGIDFDLNVLAAILAVIGYSLNDTIVVFDRIREAFISVREDDPANTINQAITDTLGRTIMTSLTTLIVLIVLVTLGGETVFSFAAALICGVLVGTYSSIFVASSFVLTMGVKREDLVPEEKAIEAEEYMP